MEDTLTTINIPIIGKVEIINANDNSSYILPLSLMFLGLFLIILFLNWLRKKGYNDQKKEQNNLSGESVRQMENNISKDKGMSM